jgi:choline-sulfatase
VDNENLLIIMADEFRADCLGCYGSDMVKTPNLDRLAAGGVRFTDAYTNSPICVPARAVFATGKYPHQTGYWDNCIAYDGRVPGWGHALQKRGIPVVSIGKLHYLDAESPTGFDTQMLPMHIHNGGDTHGLIRDEPPRRPQCRDLSEQIGPGETPYLDYDRDIRDQTCDWLRERAGDETAKPWTAFVSFISPHYPLIAPQEFYDLYNVDDIPLPKQRVEDRTASSPWWRSFENCYIWDEYFENDHQRRVAIASYYALCSFIDDNVGHIMAMLQQTGLDRSTRVVFLSDHGDNLGARGLWGKSTMYEESAKIPLIASGPGLQAGRVCKTPASLIDFAPLVEETFGLSKDPSLPGRSLWDIARLPDDPARPVFSEYHATAARSAEYMIRRGRYKYIYYLGCPPELYDLEEDAEELRNLALEDAYASLLAEFEAELRRNFDPERDDARAKAEQALLIERLGGREAILARGGMSGTPAPEAEAV